MGIPLCKKGCVAELSGTEDLSMYGRDTDEWTAIKVATKDRVMTISLDGEEVMQDSFDIGGSRFIGVRFRFQGSGWLTDVRLNEVDLL